MAIAVLLTGTNLGDKPQNIRNARKKISENIGQIIQTSSIHESAPWGFTSDEYFLNQAITVETSLSPLELLDVCQQIETSMGRKERKAPSGEKRVYDSRIIDIDILFYDTMIWNDERLTLPHPLIQDRPFVLVPLKEILPDFTHPLIQKKIREL